MVPALIAAFALVCLGFPSYDWYFDGLTFAMAAEGVAGGGNPAWLFHPHHLLYTPVAFVAYRLAGALGLSVRAWLVMQWLSTACAVGGLWLFHRLLVRLAVPAPARLAGLVLVGASYGWWRHATQGDTTLPEAALLLALLSAAVRPATPAVLLGLLQAAAVLVHESAVIFLPAAVWAIWRLRPRAARARNLATFLGVTAGVTAAAYLAVAVFVLRVPGLRGLAGWLSGYFGPDPRTGYAVYYAGWAPANLVASARAWAEGFTGGWPGPAGPAEWAWRAGAAACAIAILALAVRGIRRGLAGPPGRGARVAVEVLLVWLGAHALFFTWWKPGHTRFWVLALPGWALLAALGASPAKPAARRGSAGDRLAWIPALGLTALVAVGPFRRESNPACNPLIPVAEAVAAATPADATIVISGVGEWNALKAYLPYVARRRMLVLDWQFADKTVPPPRALVALKLRLRLLAGTGTLFWLSEAADPGLDEHFMTRHGIAGADLRAWVAARRPRLVATLAPELELWRP